MQRPKIALILALVVGLAACTSPPNILWVEMSFANGTTGAGAVAVSDQLSKTKFGKRVKAAVQSNPNLAQSDTQMQIAHANQDAARGAFLPQVSLGLNARSERLQSDLGDVSPYFRVSQLIYDGGVAAGDLAAARADFLESRGAQLQTASATALAAIETYVMVLDRRKLVEIAQSNVLFHESMERQISDRTLSGAGSKADALTARSRTADARTRFADAKARADRAEARFVEVFGAPAEALSPVVPAPDLQRTDDQIVMDSPQIRRADAAIVAARAEQAAAQARRRPEVRAAAFAVRDDPDSADFGVDVIVNYEIDSTGQRQAAIAGAEARVAQAMANREILVREIRRELGFIRSDQKAGADRLRQARIAVKANSDSIAAAQEQFGIGRRSLLDILDAQRDYVNAQERLILAEQNFFLTNYAALSLTGDILDLLGISLGIWDGL